MSKINDGGSAFPSHAGDPEMTDPRNRISCGGMSLRDWFAGQALAGMFHHEGWLSTVNGDEAEASYRAYRVADAMISARSRPEEDNG